MLLGDVDIAPIPGVVIAAILIGLLVWYFVRLRRPSVPSSRRMIRRCSIILMIVTALLALRAASFVDAAIEKENYVITWTAVVAMLGLVIMTAVVDAVNSFRIHAREHATMARDVLVHGKQEPIDDASEDAPPDIES